MSRICLLGSSHLAAFQAAHRAMPKADRADADFFGAPALLLSHLRRAGDRLICRTDAPRQWLRLTSGGRDVIELNDYRALVLVDLGLSYIDAVARRGEVRLTGEPPSDAALISPALMAALAPDRVRHSLALAVEMAGEGRTTVIVPAPRPTRAICLRWRQKPFYRDLARVAGLHRDFEDALQTLAAEKGFAVVLQPAHTRDGPFTLDAYAIDAPHPDMQSTLGANEFIHMNAAYGLEMWRLVRAAIGG